MKTKNSKNEAEDSSGFSKALFLIQLITLILAILAFFLIS